MIHAELPDAGRVTHFEIDLRLPTLAEKTVLGGFTGLANPTASVGLTAVNGVATTAIRSDGAPALDQGIVPTWTGLHTFGAGLAVSAGQGVTMADDTWIGIGAALERIVFDAAGDVSVMGAQFGIGIAPSKPLDVLGDVMVGSPTTDNTNKNVDIVLRHYHNGEEPFLLFRGTTTSGNNTVAFGGGSASYNAATLVDFSLARNHSIVNGIVAVRYKRASTSNSFGVIFGKGFVTATPPDEGMLVEGFAGFGTISPDRLTHVEVSDAVTAAITYAQRLGHTTSGAAAALFGTGTEHELEDAGGAMQVASEAVTLWAAATAGVESPLYRLSTYPAGVVGPGYAGFWTWDGVDGNVRTVIPNGAGDVARGGRFVHCIYLDTAAVFASGNVMATPGGGAVDLYNVGGDQFTLTVAADGSVSVVRAAGADTADIVLWALWIN